MIPKSRDPIRAILKSRDPKQKSWGFTEYDTSDLELVKHDTDAWGWNTPKSWNPTLMTLNSRYPNKGLQSSETQYKRFRTPDTRYRSLRSYETQYRNDSGLLVHDPDSWNPMQTRLGTPDTRDESSTLVKPKANDSGLLIPETENSRVAKFNVDCSELVRSSLTQFWGLLCHVLRVHCQLHRVSRFRSRLYHTS